MEQIISNFLSMTHEVHKRRCAIKLRVREVSEALIANCSHDWCPVRLWCKKCGVGEAEQHGKRNQCN